MTKSRQGGSQLSLGEGHHLRPSQKAASRWGPGGVMRAAGPTRMGARRGRLTTRGSRQLFSACPPPNSVSALWVSSSTLHPAPHWDPAWSSQTRLGLGGPLGR